MTNKVALVIGTVWLYTFCPLPLILCLFKAKDYVYNPKIAEDGLNAYFTSSHSVSLAM
jgi:hypothetical protein